MTRGTTVQLLQNNCFVLSKFPKRNNARAQNGLKAIHAYPDACIYEPRMGWKHVGDSCAEFQ